MFSLSSKEIYKGLFFILCVAAIQSCSVKKNSPSVAAAPNSVPSSEVKKLGDLSVSPNTFKAEASLLRSRMDASKEKMMYTFLIETILERGSSLTHVVARGDSIQAESALSSLRLLNNDKVTIVVEERMQLNSQVPLFILKSIRRNN